MTSTTIKVASATHERLRQVAKASGMTQGALIDALLDQREEADFWRDVEALDPAEVGRALTDDGDEVDDNSSREDALLDRDNQVS